MDKSPISGFVKGGTSKSHMIYQTFTMKISVKSLPSQRDTNRGQTSGGESKLRIFHEFSQEDLDFGSKKQGVVGSFNWENDDQIDQSWDFCKWTGTKLENDGENAIPRSLASQSSGFTGGLGIPLRLRHHIPLPFGW
jgi:hypothetical protein